MARSLLGLLWRWHRRLGLLVAVFALLLSGTGIVLNHSSELGLDRRFVDWQWLSRAYGDSSAQTSAYQLGAHWLSRAANGRIYFDAIDVAPCRGELVGALQADGLLYAACANELLVITANGELVESVGASTGLPTPLTAIGQVAGQPVLEADRSWWLADLDLMDFSQPATGGAIIQQLAPGQLPQAIDAALPAAEQWLSWERLLLDLHSGRAVGRAGVLWMDLMGVLIASLAMSGVVMWWLHRRRSGRR